MTINVDRCARIAMISDLTDGGAALSCRNISHGLRSAGVDAAWLAVRGDPSSGANIVSTWPDFSALLLWRLALAVRFSKLAAGVERVLLRRTMIRQIVALKPTVVHFHNVHQALDFSVMESLPRHMSLVVTLHDLWWLTGACAFPQNCANCGTECINECPEASKWSTYRRTPIHEWALRKAFYLRERDRITFVAPSQWMASIARQRLPPGSHVETILHGVDLKVFKPLPDRQSLRHILGIPASVRHVVLTGAIDLEDERKGGLLLKAALAPLAEEYGESLAVCSFGATSRSEHLSAIHIQLGATRDPRLLNLWYNAADVFVLPSRMESFGLVYVEAMAAGTPSVAFRVSACPEVVLDGETGQLAKDGDAVDLGRCIRSVLCADPQEQECRRRLCRTKAESRFVMDRVIKEYAVLYDRVTNTHKR